MLLRCDTMELYHKVRTIQTAVVYEGVLYHNNSKTARHKHQYLHAELYEYGIDGVTAICCHEKTTANSIMTTERSVRVRHDDSTTVGSTLNFNLHFSRL